jgi:hypothetical protein
LEIYWVSSGQRWTALYLVSCPCDLTVWRKHMQSVIGGAIWERPVRSLSPLALVDSVHASAKIWLLVGSDDQIAPSALTLAYAEALRNRNVAVNVTIASGLSLVTTSCSNRSLWNASKRLPAQLMLEGSGQLLAQRCALPCRIWSRSGAANTEQAAPINLDS